MKDKNINLVSRIEEKMKNNFELISTGDYFLKKYYLKFLIF